jgi:hypothetical protein
MVEKLEILGTVLKIVAALSSIGFTYYQFRKSNKKPKEKGSSDVAASDKPKGCCPYDNK